MIVKRKLFSFLDEDGNLGYYLYNESTGEEKLFSVVEEEREFARKDYYYLSEEEALALRAERNKLAAEARAKRSQILKDKASWDAAAMGDKKVLDANNAARSSNYKSVLAETKSKAENLRNKALENSTNTTIGKESNSLARKATPKTNPTATNIPNTLTTSIPNTSTSSPTVSTTAKSITIKSKSAPKPKVNIGKSLLFNGSFNPMKWSKEAKIGGGIAAGTALIGTGMYLHKKNKKNKE